jgi:hypothetical protein
MLPHYTPWFYWNFVGATRDKLFDILAPEQVYELICDTGKSEMWGRSYYPIENPPGTIRTITRRLESLGVFDRVFNKKQPYGNK